MVNGYKCILKKPPFCQREVTFETWDSFPNILISLSNYRFTLKEIDMLTFEANSYGSFISKPTMRKETNYFVNE